MKNWFTNIFQFDKSSTIYAGAFNHCSSLCAIGNNTILAWYSGTGECKDDQSVHITYISNLKSSTTTRIGNKTGNPILWKENNKIWLLWSKFEDDCEIVLPAHRWRHCSLWIQQLKIENETIIPLGKPKQFSDSSLHLLARTNPITIEETTYLPLYDEAKRECVIYSGHNGNYYELSRFGQNLRIIQPAIWYENNRLHSLSRNFGNSKRKSIYNYSDDMGKTWRYGGLSRFWNVNNSLAIEQYDGQKVILWNNTSGIYRKDMTIGIIDWVDMMPQPIALQNMDQQHGSYPSLCITDNDQLHFSFTNQNRCIQYHVWNLKKFRTELTRNRRIYRNPCCCR